nr:class II aldolase/adducin family protein [Candidatus Sigynarchaeota archaeon]
MSQEDFTEYLEQVLKGAKAIYEAGLVQFGEGNVSIRMKKGDEFFITPSQNDYATMTVGDVVHMKFDGTQLSKGKPTSSEYKLHVAIYQARPKVNCVIHAHAPHAAMLSITNTELPVIFEEMVIFLGPGPVRVARYGASGSDELGKNALDAMGDKNVCLLTNHSIVGCGRDLEKTLKTMNLVEKMAMVYIGALRLGKVETLSDDKVDKFADYFKGLYSTAPKKKKDDV